MGPMRVMVFMVLTMAGSGFGDGAGWTEGEGGIPAPCRASNARRVIDITQRSRSDYNNTTQHLYLNSLRKQCDSSLLPSDIQCGTVPLGREICGVVYI